MPKSDSSNPNGGPSFQGPRYRPNWSAAAVCFIIGTYLSAALIDYEPNQTPFHSTAQTAKNWVGWLGADTVWVLFYAIGITTWLLPVALYWMFFVAVRNSRHLVATRVTALVVGIVAMSGLLAMFESVKPDDRFPNAWGGWVGHTIYQRMLADALGPFGTALFLGTIYAFALLFVVTKDIGVEIEKILSNFTEWRAERKRRKAALAEEIANRKDDRAKQRAANLPALPPLPAQPVGPSGAKKIMVARGAEDPLLRAPPRVPPGDVAAKPEVKPPVKDAAPKIALTIVKPEEPKKAKVVLPQTFDENYEFPPVKLLKEQAKPAPGNSDEEHRHNAETLLRILGEFGVEVSLGEIHVGPVITRYEVVPAPGVRVEKIAGLDKNIALGMRAQSVRILAPIPGKAAVGVEVPNLHPTPVGMRELLESEDWASAKAELPIALGRDVSGKPLISDLAKMPHLMIAGATGSGKSVCINSIVTSILYSKSPKDVRLIMVDPKVVELKVFNSLPHMFIPVVTEPKKVPAALKWLLSEMEQRYQIFAKANVRNIVGFNTRKKDAKPVPENQPALQGLDPLANDELEMPAHLPYIVAIIDELADLMILAPAEIETSIARLAQLARAAGIHLIIATQRPSVNVITGVIKANLPSRIAFQVASQVDSRTILDTKGAETLIGRGDMLFSPPGTSRLVRAQGAFVGDEEVHDIVEFLKRNGPPQYAQAVQQQIDRAASEDDEEAEDADDGDLGSDEDLYVKALDVLKSTRRASTSMLQRRLRIGYNRAARIMEMMEEKGVVGPENGSSPREIIGDLDAP
ncbi:MAG TPA: DNA translocase FtsK 4TM domain-containing protein [Opitutaceae bacterium]